MGISGTGLIIVFCSEAVFITTQQIFRQENYTHSGISSSRSLRQGASEGPAEQPLQSAENRCRGEQSVPLIYPTENDFHRVYEHFSILRRRWSGSGRPSREDEFFKHETAEQVGQQYDQIARIENIGGSLY